MLKRLGLFSLTIFFSVNIFAQNQDSVTIRKIFSETLENGKAYDWLRDLTSEIGGRLTGSPEAAKAVEWARKTMIESGADTVFLQEVTVPHWVRGAKEKGTVVESNGKKQDVPVVALGNSVATPSAGITAEVIEVHDFTELKALGEKSIKGKIVFYNHPFDEKKVNTFDAYGEAVGYRWAGPSEAARYGAVASICRSMSNISDDHPHTGAMHYNDSLAKIPCIAISTNGADLLSRILHSDKKTSFFMQVNSQMLDSVKSYNVIGEMRGAKHPEEIVVVGGHLDSWDTGKGAHDDGAGVVQSMEVLRAFKAAGIHPDRTIRAVAFMNEENGLRGGKTYAELAKNTKHIAAIESDAGGFLPIGFGLNFSEDKKKRIRRWAPLFLPYGIYDFGADGDGADISPMEKMNVACMGLEVNSQRYFDYHHTETDTFDKVNKRELHLGAAAMASMVYLLSEYGLEGEQ